jgi:hypothetical protein
MERGDHPTSVLAYVNVAKGLGVPLAELLAPPLDPGRRAPID